MTMIVMVLTCKLKDASLVAQSQTEMEDFVMSWET